jgi:hypothetical protein
MCLKSFLAYSFPVASLFSVSFFYFVLFIYLKGKKIDFGGNLKLGMKTGTRIKERREKTKMRFKKRKGFVRAILEVRL